MQSLKAIFLASAAVSFLFVTAASAQEHPNREHHPQSRLQHHARIWPHAVVHAFGGVHNHMAHRLAHGH
jgi:hypothetical protein